jgi:FkbM family methyltransferase
MKCISEKIFSFFKKIFFGNYRHLQSSLPQITPPSQVSPPPPIEAQLFDLKQKQKVDLDGFSIFVMPEDYVGWSILTARVYESHVTKVVRTILHPHDVFLDVGANLGFFSLLASSLVGDGGKVLAVEPNPQNIQLIYDSILVNKFTNITVFPFAASDTSGFLEFINVGSNGCVVTPKALGNPHSFLAQSIRLDEWLPIERRLDVIKIDIEAHEPMAVRGMVNLIKRHHPRILTEFHPWAMNLNNYEPPEDYLHALESLGYKISLVHADCSGCEAISPLELMRRWRSLENETNHFDLLAEPK